jgi:multidrug efflux pump subunit AcrB
MKLAWTQRHRAFIIASAVLLLVLGVLASFRLPLQLLPDIEEPSLSIMTVWPGASASEIERVITEPQERAMRGMRGLNEITANANRGQSWLELRFEPGTALDPAFVDVIGRLQRVPALPRDVQAPQVSRGSNGAGSTLIYFFVQLLPQTAGPVERFQPDIEQRVLQPLLQVPGVASGQINSGADRELRISIDVAKAASLGLSLDELSNRLARLDDVSAGAIDIGRTSYTMRVHAGFDPAQLELLPVGRIGDRTIMLSEVASADFVRPDRSNLSYQNGNPALTIQLFREPGSNVLETLERLDQVIAELEAGYLNEAGLAIRKSFEPGIFIRRAMGFLGGNLGMGLLAALSLLWLFLRDLRATLLIAVAVPLSLAVTLLALAALGRNLNMISIAALAFAVGMVMDAAIVVVESVLAERSRGLKLIEATIKGASKVMGALFASTLTVVAVFLPVLALDGIEAQIFGDLALTLSISVVVSLAVAIWVVPALLPLLGMRTAQAQSALWSSLAKKLARHGRSPRAAMLTRVLLIAAPIALSVILAPARDYLPPVKRAAVDSFLQLPPGMGTDRIEREIIEPIMERMRPYMEGTQEPALLNYYVLTWPNGGTLGARVKDASQIGALETLLNEKILKGLPDLQAFAREGELFGGIGGGDRSIWINLRGGDLKALRSVALAAEEKIKTLLPDAVIGITPGANADAAEISIQPKDLRLNELGLSRPWLANAIQVLGDGRYLGEYFDGNRSIPMLLRGPVAQSLEQLSSTPLALPTGATATGGQVLLGDVAELSMVRAPADLRRVNFARAVTLSVNPSDAVALEDALALLEAEIVPSIRSALPPGASLDIGGSAGRLDAITRALLNNLLLALLCLSAILLLLLRSGFDTVVVLITLPLAALGGVIGLRLLGWFVPQSLDLLSMIGFVMLLAMVVANAVLLVSATRQAQADGMALEAAIEWAMRERLRALTLGALTGVVGALPLALSPAPGASIYRGLAAVTCGGVTLSLLLVVFLVPSMLRWQAELRALWARWRPRRLKPAQAMATDSDAGSVAIEQPQLPDLDQPAQVARW